MALHIDLHVVRQYLITQVLPAEYASKQGAAILRRCSAKFEMDGELMLYKGKATGAALQARRRIVVLTDAEKDAIFADIHMSDRGGHMAVRKTSEAISSRYYWHAIVSDVTERIARCDQCQRNAVIKVHRPLQPIVTKEPWEVVGIDAVGPLKTTKGGKKYIISATCLFTKYVEAFSVPDKSANSISKCLKTLCLRFGPPKRVITDQGREFVNSVNKELFALFGVHHMVTSAYHPQTNGQDEKTNGNLQRILRKIVNAEHNDWDEKLEDAVFALNSKKQTSTKQTPFLLMFKREPTVFSELQYLSQGADEETLPFPAEPTAAEADQYLGRMNEFQDNLHASTKLNIEKAQERQKKTYDKKSAQGSKCYTFAVGDKVLKRNIRNVDRKGGKMEPLWLGKPFFIIEHIKGQSAYLSTRGVTCKKAVSLLQLKPYLQVENENDPEQDCDDPEAAEFTDAAGVIVIDGVVDDNAVFFEDGIPMGPMVVEEADSSMEFDGDGNVLINDADLLHFPGDDDVPSPMRVIAALPGQMFGGNTPAAGLVEPALAVLCL